MKQTFRDQSLLVYLNLVKLLTETEGQEQIDCIIYTLHMQIMKCPQKIVTIMKGMSRKSKISPFNAVDMKVFFYTIINPSSTLSLNGAYRHKHPLTLTHTHAQRTVTKSPFLQMHVSGLWEKGRVSADNPCRHGNNTHTPESNQRVTYSNSLAEQGQNAAFVFMVGKPRNLQKV